MKRNRFLGLLLAAAMLFTCMGGVTGAKAAQIDVAAGTDAIINVLPGQTNHVKIPVRAIDSYLTISSMSIIPSADAPFTISGLAMSDANGNPVTGSIYMQKDVTYNLEFDVVVKDSAEIGYYTAELKCSGLELNSLGETSFSNQSLMTMTLYVPVEKDPIQLSASSISYGEDEVIPGNTFNMSITVKNDGERQALNTYLNLDLGDSGLIPGYSVKNQKLGTLHASGTANVTLPIDVLATAEAGLKKITVNLTCKDSSGKESSFTHDIYININEAGITDNAPFLTLTTENNYKELTPESNDSISVKITNNGNETAYNIKLSVKSGLGPEVGITKAYTSDSITVKNIKKGETKTVKIPVTVAKSLSAGLKELVIEAEYTNEKSVPQKAAAMTMYVKGPDALTKDESVRNIVTITNVSQSPSKPQAGEKLTVTFKINNEGTHDIKDVKLTGDGLSSAGFEPLTPEPYQYVGDIKQGKSKTVSMSFGVGEKIPEGLNNLSILYTFIDANDETVSETVKLYILDVENSVGMAIGRPKIIISNYETSIPELKAGSEFELKFRLKNTHQAKSAKNIKVTVTQADGVFAATQGSNIFYIDRIEAGQEVENTISLKTRANATTGDYDLVVKVEYEYDEMSDADLEKGGVSEDNTLKLHAVENYRPSVENLNIENWDGVYVNQPVTLTYEFYNMGKSTLGNIYATIEGDFTLDNSTKYYMSSVEGYGYQYCDFPVIPLVTGEAKGTLIIHFEDSNGDENTFTQEFSTFVSEAPSIIPGGDAGFDPSIPVDGGGMMPEVKEPIMDLWVFIAIQTGVLLIGILITFKVRIAVAKKKLRKQLEAED